MNKFLLAALPAALFATAFAVHAAGNAQDVQSKLAAAGYTEVRDLEFDGGLWEAEVLRADGRWGEVAYHEATDQVFDVKDGRTIMDARSVADALEAAGYTEISDLDRDGGLWEAEARDSTGQRVELRLSGIDGSVLNSDVEHDD
jgi:hypothetical protein